MNLLFSHEEAYIRKKDLTLWTEEINDRNGKCYWVDKADKDGPSLGVEYSNDRIDIDARGTFLIPCDCIDGETGPVSVHHIKWKMNFEV